MGIWLWRACIPIIAQAEILTQHIVSPSYLNIFKGDGEMKNQIIDKLMDGVIGTTLITLVFGSLVILANIVY